MSNKRKSPQELADYLWGNWLLDLSLTIPLRQDPNERDTMAADIAHVITADRDASDDYWRAAIAKLQEERDEALQQVKDRGDALAAEVDLRAYTQRQLDAALARVKELENTTCCMLLQQEVHTDLQQRAEKAEAECLRLQEYDQTVRLGQLRELEERAKKAEARVRELGEALTEALSALGYPAPGDFVPRRGYRCGLCGPKEAAVLRLESDKLVGARKCPDCSEGE
jgi:hypothetical protein